ncbi:hypothetical protein GCM10020219_045890 [Nonomuraea dietziae]
MVDRFNRLHLKRDTEATRRMITEGPCPACAGARLNAAALASRIDGLNLADYSAMEISDLAETLRGLGNGVAEPAIEALNRIEAIGLGYLSLDRETSSLSGGEAQRLKTVRHLGSSLSGADLHLRRAERRPCTRATCTCSASCCSNCATRATR